MKYFICIIVLFICELIYFKIAKHFNIIDKPNERSSHTRTTLRGGGIIFYIGMLIYFIASKFAYPWFFAGLTMITFISFVDDIHSITQEKRLIFHFTAMTLMFYQLNLFTRQSWWLCIIALILCIGAINAYNFMDGINGITGGYSLVMLVALAYVNEHVIHFVDIDFIRAAALAVFVFCFFNFRKHAKSFAGDVGSLSIIFIILFLLGKLMLLTKDLSWLTFLVVYGTDTGLTGLHRLILHENLGLPHRKHAYQIMANELKIPHVAVSIIYMSLQAAIDTYYIYRPGYITLVASICILSVAYAIFIKKYYHLHRESLNAISE